MRDFLSRTDFREGAEGGCIEIQCECFMVRVEFLNGRHCHKIQLGKCLRAVERP